MAAGKGPIIALIHGNDEFRVSSASRAFLEETCPDAEASDCLTRLDGAVDSVGAVEEVARRFLTSIRSLSMFGDTNVTWLQNASFLTGGGPVARFEGSKDWVEKLITALGSGLGPEQIVLISAPYKLDSRSRFLKAVAAVGVVREFSHSAKSWEQETEVRTALKQALDARKIKAPGDAIEALMARLGNDSRLLASEVEKLDLYLGERRMLAAADVYLMVPASREVPAYEFCNQVAERNLVASLASLRQLEAQKASPIGILAQLTNQFRDMALYRAAIAEGAAKHQASSRGGSLSWTDPDAEAMAVQILGGRKPSPFRAAMLAGQSLAYTVAELDRIFRAVADAYYQQFRSSIPPFMQIELLVLKICEARVPASRR